MPTTTCQPVHWLPVLIALFAIPAAHTQNLGLHAILEKPILAPNQPTVEVKAYTAARVPTLRIPTTRQDWETSIRETRRRVLDEVIFRGEARAWRNAKTKVEWLGTIPSGPGYHIKKLRYEAAPGVWIPALLYEPENLKGKVPVVINVNGHDRTSGKATEYKQIRVINQAKRGLLAINLEWIGMGQLNTPGFDHTRMTQLDLLGTSGIALHYLAQKRAIDLMLDHPNADPDRVAVTGLSGGGWQTIFISSLDERVALANPVAGYSSFVTRTQFPSLDLGDAEQTPSDLASVADYTHLTAMRAPRPTLITKNARDTCCFKAENSLAPLMQASQPIFDLYDRPGHLRQHINQDPGHNYGKDNREAFYRMLRDFFFGGDPNFSAEEINVDSEVKSFDDLKVELPRDNLDFHQLALKIAKSMPRPTGGTRDDLREVTVTPRYKVEARMMSESADGDYKAKHWRLRMDNAWTVPAVEIEMGPSNGTVLLVADGGRQSASGEAREWLRKGRRVIVVDPFYYGESHTEGNDWLWSILIAALGERPLGVQAGQIAAAARWALDRHDAAVQVDAVGPRTSLAALIAAALETEAVSGLRLQESLSSLHEIIERDINVLQAPELFCFGLAKAFDVDGIKALVAPRRVESVRP